MPPPVFTNMIRLLSSMVPLPSGALASWSTSRPIMLNHQVSIFCRMAMSLAWLSSWWLRGSPSQSYLMCGPSIPSNEMWLTWVRPHCCAAKVMSTSCSIAWAHPVVPVCPEQAAGVVLGGPAASCRTSGSWPARRSGAPASAATPGTARAWPARARPAGRSAGRRRRAASRGCSCPWRRSRRRTRRRRRAARRRVPAAPRRSTWRTPARARR